MIFYENIHCFLMKFFDSFYEILRNFMTLMVSQKQNTGTCKIDNYITKKQRLLFIIALDIRLKLKLQ